MEDINTYFADINTYFADIDENIQYEKNQIACRLFLLEYRSIKMSRYTGTRLVDKYQSLP